MTIIEKSHTNANYYISIELTTRYNNSIYIVQVCPIIGENLCGYPEKEMVYSIGEKEKAYKTFKRYIKKYL